MSLGIPFEMKNLASFRMEKLCYDLKLEVLKEMDAKVMVDLVKVNAEFQSMLSREPWLVFGHHVHCIRISDGRFCLAGDEILLQKFPGSDWVKFDAPQLPLAQRIHSCDEFRVDWCQEEVIDEFVTILNQMKSVNILGFSQTVGNGLAKFLENFHAMVRKSIWMPGYLAITDEVVSKLLDNFIANHANDCKKVCIRDTRTFYWYYGTFAKTSIKFFDLWWMMEDKFEEIVQSIVKKQIPSKDLKAAVYIATGYSREVYARLVDFLSLFPGMKRLVRESRQEVIEMAKALAESVIEVDDNCWVLYPWIIKNGLFFQRNIDLSKDCVYMLYSDKDPNEDLYFLAFSVQSQ